MERWGFTAILLAIASSCAACTDESDPGGTATGTTPPGTTTGTGTYTGTTSSNGGAGGTSAGAPCEPVDELGTGGYACDPVGYAGPTIPTEVHSLTATIVELNGKPAANIGASLVGENLCLNAQADAQGHISVVADGNTFEDGRLMYGTGSVFMLFGAPLFSPSGDGNFDMGTLHTARLPDFAAGVPLALGQELTSGDVTIGLDPDAFVEFELLGAYDDCEQQNFRAVTVPPESTNLPGVDEALGLEMMFGLAPIHTQICPPASLTVPNLPGWDAEADVEFLYYGTTIYYEDWAPWGGWAKMADGKVSADGSTVSTNDGEGMNEIGVIGVRLKP